jgi:hypothetical protein
MKVSVLPHVLQHACVNDAIAAVILTASTEDQLVMVAGKEGHEIRAAHTTRPHEAIQTVSSDVYCDNYEPL